MYVSCCTLGVGVCIAFTSSVSVHVVLYIGCRCMYCVVVYTGCRHMYCVVLYTECRCMSGMSSVGTCIAWCCKLCVVVCV